MEEMKIFRGTGVNSHSAMGKLRFLLRSEKKSEEKAKTDPEKEEKLFLDAVLTAKKELDELYRGAVEGIGRDEAEIFRIHAMLLEDEEYKECVQSFIFGGERADMAVMSGVLHLFMNFALEALRVIAYLHKAVNRTNRCILARNPVVQGDGLIALHIAVRLFQCGKKFS